MESRDLILVTSEFPPAGGGIGKYVSQLSKALLPLGWNCWVAVWGTKLTIDYSTGVIRIPFLRLPPIGDFLFASRFNRMTETLGLKDALINIHTPYPQAAIAPDLVTVHNVIKRHLSRGSYSGMKWLQYTLGFRALVHNEKTLITAPTVCTVSRAVVSELREEYGIS